MTFLNEEFPRQKGVGWELSSVEGSQCDTGTRQPKIWTLAVSLGQTEEAKRLWELEVENSRLKKMAAESSLDKEVLEEVLKGNY